MSITINSNVVSGPEERPIPAHLSFGQFMFDQLKTGGDNVALVTQNVYDCSKDMPYVEQVITFGDFDVIPGLMFNDLIKEYVDVDSFVLEDVDGAQDALA
ncbi:UTP--glucose-1-phosphate uridylyltransferase, partial [Operophtera brumata]